MGTNHEFNLYVEYLYQSVTVFDIHILLIKVRVRDALKDTVLQRRPPIHACPLFQKCDSVRLVERHFDVIRDRVVVDKILLRMNFA